MPWMAWYRSSGVKTTPLPSPLPLISLFQYELSGVAEFTPLVLRFAKSAIGHRSLWVSCCRTRMLNLRFCFFCCCLLPMAFLAREAYSAAETLRPDHRSQRQRRFLHFLVAGVLRGAHAIFIFCDRSGARTVVKDETQVKKNDVKSMSISSL